MSIEIRSLKKRYGNFELEADLSVGDNETLVIAGPSGCGKTTALQMIAGLVRPDSGEVIVDGKPVNDLPPWKRGIGVVFQDLALFPHLSVGGNVGYGPLIAGIDRKRRKEIVTASLTAVRLAGYEKRRVDTLSGGERQRVAIARALAAAPNALLMDEPFSSLDAPLRRSLRSEFRQLRARERFPCIFVTHDREEAAAVGDRIAVMDGGRIVECGTPTSLFNEPRTAFVARFLGSGSILPILSSSKLPGGAARVMSELGEAVLPFPAGPGRTLLFPPDAVSLAPAEESGRPRLTVAETAFEGDGTGVVLETANGDRLRTTLNRRMVPPDIGETVGVRIDWALVRTVSESTL